MDIDIDKWLEGFDAFSDERVMLAITKAEEEARELRERSDALLTRAASFRILLDARQRNRQQNAVVEAPAAAATATVRPPTVGQVLSKRPSTGTSQAILDLMRTDPDSEWPIARILDGLVASDQLPNS